MASKDPTRKHKEPCRSRTCPCGCSNVILVKLGQAVEQVNSLLYWTHIPGNEESCKCRLKAEQKEWQRLKFPDIELVEDCVGLILRCAGFIGIFWYKMAKEIIVIIEMCLKVIGAWTGTLLLSLHQLSTDIFAFCLHDPGCAFKTIIDK